MKKAAILSYWKSLSRPRELAPRPVPYRHRGSTYDQDGIRITGSRAFLDAVLSRLTDLLAFENGRTRLQVSYQEATDKASGRPLGSWSCYVQVHERGAPAYSTGALADLLAGFPVTAGPGPSCPQEAP
jgi:hypothetical protein